MRNNAYKTFHDYVVQKCSSKYTSKNDVSILQAIDDWAYKRPLSELEQLDEYLYERKTGKKSIKRLLLEFYESQSVTTILNDVEIIDDPIRRVMEEIEYLHVPRSRQELQEHFGIGDSALRNDLKLMQSEFFVSGSPFHVTLRKANNKLYLDELRQPVVLMLDRSQCSTLSKGLLRLAQVDSLHADILEKLAEDMYEQFSSKVKEGIGDIHFTDKKKLRNEAYKSILIQMLDEGKRGSFTCVIPDEGVVDIDHCRVIDYDVLEQTIRIEKEDGNSFWTKVKDIYWCEIEEKEEKI